MTPEVARDLKKKKKKKKKGGQNVDFEGCYLLKNSPKLKKMVMNDPKSHQKSKIGGHFYKMCTYDPHGPPLVQPLPIGQYMMGDHKMTVNFSQYSVPNWQPVSLSSDRLTRLKKEKKNIDVTFL